MPEDLNIIVTSLPEYVEQNRDQLIRVVVLGGNTIRHMVPQTGIKTKAAINYLDVDPAFQDGAGCGFNAQEGGIELTQREIATGLIKVNMTVCPDKLLGKYAEYLVKIGATEDELPFEEFIIQGIIEAINAKMEKAVWQGDTDSQDGDLNKFDGLLKLAAEEDDTVIVNFAEDDTVWDKIKKVYTALPEEALERGKVSAFISAEDFRAFMLELVEKNFFHYDGAHNEAPEEFVFPGTNLTVVKSNGLNRTGKMYATYDRNLYYGCDLENNKEEVKVWFSDDDDIFKIKVKWNAGVQTAFPDMVVIGYKDETPTPTPTISGAATVNMANTAGSANRTYATSDGSAVSAEVTTEGADWLSVAVGTGNKVTFTATAQEAAAEARSASVKLSTATGAEKTVTVNQAAGE